MDSIPPNETTASKMAPPGGPGESAFDVAEISRLRSKPPVVLIVDDEATSRKMLRGVMRIINANVVQAPDGNTALDVLSQEHVDLILLDIQMEEMDGFELCTHIRRDPRYWHIPIIFITGYADKENLLKGFEVGAQDFVSKPVDVDELAARVQAQLKTKIKIERLRTLNTWLERKIFEEKTSPSTGTAPGAG